MPEAAWFDPADGKTDPERRFLSALQHRAARWHDLAVDPDDIMVYRATACLTIGVDLIDRERNCGVRTLRVDFDGRQVVCGEDPTHQFVTGLVPGCAGIVAREDPGAPESLAGFAADWIESELRRPIVRHEWERTSFRHTRWLMADTGKTIVWSDSANEPRRELGQADRVFVVRERR